MHANLCLLYIYHALFRVGGGVGDLFEIFSSSCKTSFVALGKCVERVKNSNIVFKCIYAITKSMRALWLVKKVKKVLCFTAFVHALCERAVFGAAEFDNRTFEGESFFNRSSVSHLNHAPVKCNSKWRENCAFHIAYSDLRAIKLFSCTPVIDKDSGFKITATRLGKNSCFRFGVNN